MAMFDPIFFDNLKVVIEGAVYDRDLNSEIRITNRSDLVDLASMSRRYSIEFELLENANCSAEIQLEASMNDIAAELNGIQDSPYGGDLLVLFQVPIRSDINEITNIEQMLKDTWSNRPTIYHSISLLPTFESNYEWIANFKLDFGRKIGEAQLEDMGMFVEYICKTLLVLDHKD